MSKAIDISDTYYSEGRYLASDLESFLGADALKQHDALIIAGFSCRPVDDDDGKGVKYTVGCGCCSLDLCYCLSDDGWRASTYVTSAGVIYGDSKINDEYADSPEEAVDHLLERLSDESSKGPVEERGYIHAAHEAIEETLKDWIGESEEDDDET